MKLFLSLPVPAILSAASILFLISCEIGDYPFFIKGGTITVAVDGRSGPWDVSVNSTDDYGGGTQIEPAVVDNSSGISIAEGNKVTVTYVSGLANSGGGGLWYDADGVDADAGYAPSNGESGSISSYMEASELPVNLGELVGVFADGEGVIVGPPFKIGNGPRELTVPKKAKRLQLGVNDGMYSDNGGTLTLRISNGSD